MKLSDAIKADDPDEVRKSLRRVKNINQPLRNTSYPPLAYAVQCNAGRVIPMLLDAGASPCEAHSLHPLYLAASDGRDAALESLLQYQAWESDQLQDAVRAAALHNRIAALRLLLEKSPATPSPAALCAAAFTGRYEALCYLMDHGGDPAAFDNRESALHTAARCGFPDLIGAILDRGVDVNLRDQRGRTPLIHAAVEHMSQRYDRVSRWQTRRDLANPNSGSRLISGTIAAPPYARRTIELLLAAGANPAHRDNEGYTAFEILHHEGRGVDEWLEKKLVAHGMPPVDHWPMRLIKAISAADVPAVTDLLSQGRSPNYCTARGFTPLTHAGRIGSSALVQCLLRAGADPNFRDKTESPLAAAVVGKSVEVVQLLLDAGAAVTNDPDSERSKNELQLAKDLGYREIAKLLLERGAHLDPPKNHAIHPGVHWWDDWEFVVVKADVPTIAKALDPSGKSIDLNPLGKTFRSIGQRTFVLAQPKGLPWTNVLQSSPVWRHQGEEFKDFARELAIKVNAPAIHAAYSDTAVAAAFICFDANGSVQLDDRGNDLEWAQIAVDSAAEMGEEPPAWATEMIRLADESGEDPPTSMERLESLAKNEGFALGWASFGVPPGEEFEVEFRDYSPVALTAVAFVDATSKS